MVQLVVQRRMAQRIQLVRVQLIETVLRQLMTVQLVHAGVGRRMVRGRRYGVVRTAGVRRIARVVAGRLADGRRGAAQQRTAQRAQRTAAAIVQTRHAGVHRTGRTI